MIWAFLLGVFLGGAIFFALGTAYGVRCERDRLIAMAWAKLRAERAGEH